MRRSSIRVVKLPEPAITFAIEPKSRADEDKLGVGLHKLMEEDAMLRFFRDPQTKEFLIAGTGQQHIEVVVSKMKKRYHAEVVLKAPKVPYRETIRGKADVQGRHKKQTGGHGQYGDCKIKMEPLPRGGEFEFVNDIFGGAIPKNYHSRRSKRESRTRRRAAILRDIPWSNFRVILYDGSYHDVDSNDLSFQMAGRIAFKKAMEVAKPTLLEPIMTVEITVPDEFAGTIMGDLNSRRGRIQGMDNKGWQHDREGRGSHGGDADLRRRSHFDDAGPRQLQHGNAPLRRGAGTTAGEDYREGEGAAWRGEGRRGISKRKSYGLLCGQSSLL